DGVGLIEADVRPGLAGVGGLLDAVARLDIAADALVAPPASHEVGIGFGDGDGPDRRAVDLPVSHRRPGLAAVNRFPESAARLPAIGDLRLSLDAAGGDRAPRARRADAAPLIRLEH